MRGLKCDRTARVIMRGHAFMQNMRRGHYELGVEARPRRRVAAAFSELAQASLNAARTAPRPRAPSFDSTQQSPPRTPACVNPAWPNRRNR
jgi:hypothetical protein